jgi:DNA-binding transcriptional ArsR family regulator
MCSGLARNIYRDIYLFVNNLIDGAGESNCRDSTRLEPFFDRFKTCVPETIFKFLNISGGRFLVNPYDESARILRVIAHPVRLQLLEALTTGEECVCHLTALLGKRQAYISQQLAALRGAGLVIEHKEGLRVYYRLKDPRPRAILGVLRPPALASPKSQQRSVVRGCHCPQCNQKG